MKLGVQTDPTGEDGEDPFVQVHDGIVGALVLVDDGIGVQADDEVVAQGTRLLQKVQVADVEQVEGAGHVDDAVARRRLLAFAELDDPPRRRQKLRQPRPR